MVTIASCGDLEWGIASLLKPIVDPRIDHQFNHIISPIAKHENDKYSLKFSLRLDACQPIKGWETVLYDRSGFVEGCFTDPDEKVDASLLERNLHLYQPIRRAIAHLAAEWDCNVYYLGLTQRNE